MKKTFWVIALLGSIMSAAVAQTKTALLFAQTDLDTSVVAKYSNCLSVHLYTSMRNNFLSYKDLTMPRGVQLAANEPLSIGIGLTWRWLELDANFSLPNTTEQRLGNTQRFSLFTVFYPKKWAIEGYYGRFQGFYIHNPTDFDADWFQKNAAFPSLNGQYYENASIDAYRIANHRQFAYQAIYCKSTRHLKNTGSLLWGGYGSFIHTANSVAHGYDTQNFNAELSKLEANNCRFWNAGVSAGYTRAWVYNEKWFLNALLTLGVGTTFQLHQDAHSAPPFNLGAKAKIRTSIGYNDYNWYTGLLYANDTYAFDGIGQMFFLSEISNFKLFIGYRFAFAKPQNKPQ